MTELELVPTDLLDCVTGGQSFVPVKATVGAHFNATNSVTNAATTMTNGNLSQYNRGREVSRWAQAASALFSAPTWRDGIKAAGDRFGEVERYQDDALIRFERAQHGTD